MELLPNWSNIEKNRNLFQVAIDTSINESAQGSPKCSQANHATIRYEPSELRQIYMQNRHDQRYKQLPFGSIRNIRHYRLNKRPSKTRNRKERLGQKGVNLTNLHQIQINDGDGNLHDTNLRIATVNVQSIKNKEQALINYANEYSLDIIAVTE